MNVLRFTVRAGNYAEVIRAIAREMDLFLGTATGTQSVQYTNFDAHPVYMESGNGDRRLLHYEADVEVRIP